jgi:phage-related minor tail protein
MANETRRIEWLLTGRNEVSRVFNEAQRDMSKLQGVFTNLQAAAATIGGFALLREMKVAAIEAEQAGIRLDAVLKATGHSAGLTRQQLEKMTESLTGDTAFDDDSIRAAQAAFLKFGNIQGDVFGRGLKLAADWAAFVGTNIPEAAQSLGKALQSPDEGLRSLEKEFGKLSFTQKENIKVLMEQGKLLEAQAQVLAIVESRVGGTAAKMREGLGGASAAVKREFGELLETLGKSNPKPLEGLASLLTDIRKTIEGTKNPLSELLLGLAHLGDKLSFQDGSLGNRFANGVYAALGAGKGVAGKITNPNEEQAVAQLSAMLAREQAKVDAQAEKSAELRKKQIAEGEAAAKRQQAARESLLDGYDREINKLNELTEVEKLLFDIQKGKFGVVTQAFRVQAEQQARLVDQTREEKKLREEMEKALKDDVGARARLTSDAEQINAQLESARIATLELQGRGGEAAGRRFDQQNRPLVQTFGLTEEIKRYRDLTVAAANFNAERENQERLTQRLGIEEERIQNSLRTGAISEFEAMNRTSQARQRAATELENIVVNLEAMAAASENPALVVQAEAARSALEKLRAETNLLADSFNRIFADNFSNPFADFISGTKSAKDAFKQFADSVLRDINNMVAKDIAGRIFGGSGGGGIGGLFATIFGGGGFAAEGGSAGGFGGVGTNEAGGFLSLISNFLGSFDTGTEYVPRDGLAMVHKGERIVPAAQNRAGFGGTVIVNYHDAGGGDTRSGFQRGLEIGRGINRTLSRA